MKSFHPHLLGAFFLPFFLFSLTASQVIWNKPANWNAGLPDSIQVFQTNSSFAPHILTTASYCLFDLSDPDLELKVVIAPNRTAKTPLQFAEEEPNHVYMVSNGGFFDMAKLTSSSLVISEGVFKASALPEQNGSYHGHKVHYYPTPGALGIYENGTVEVAWTYGIHHNISDIWAYPEPNDICLGCEPKSMPSGSFPSGGKSWKVKNAIGGGPVLMKNGSINITSEQELISAAITGARNPRTVLCITKDKKMIVMAVDGRYSLSSGVLLNEVAEILQDLGCEDALNLDGGGSTALVVNGFVTNHPSDASGMRHVTNALILVSKTKPKDLKKDIVII